MTPDQLKNKRYLGDGVYVGYDGYHIWLYSDDGYKVTNEIALDLEPEVVDQLKNWLEWVKTQ